MGITQSDAINGGVCCTGLASIDVQVENLMKPYLLAVNNRGGSLNYLEKKELHAFYRYLIENNYLSDIVDFGVCLGGNLGASLISNKRIASLDNHNFVFNDYVHSTGPTLTSNSNKYLGTGIIPTQFGLSENDICAMVYRTTEPVVTTNSYMMGMNNASGFNDMSIGFDVGMGTSIRTSPTCVGMIGITSLNSICTPYFDLTQVMDDFTPASVAFDTEITLFKGKRSGIDRFTAGGLGFWLIGAGITKARYIALTKAVYIFLENIGRRAAGSDFVICGDSVTLGSDSTYPGVRYSRLLANYYGLREANFGLGGTRLRNHNTNVRDFEERYTELANYRIGNNYPDGRIHLQYLINDMTLDSDDNGTLATANACRDAYVTIINYIKNVLGVPRENISLGAPGYTTVHNDTKRALYCSKAQEAAQLANIKFCNPNQKAIDGGNPSQYMSDGLHPNNLGHKEEYFETILTAA